MKKVLILGLLSMMLCHIGFAQSKANWEICKGYSIYNFGNAGLRESMSSFKQYNLDHGEPNITITGVKIAHDNSYGINYNNYTEGMGTVISGLHHYRFTNSITAQYGYGSRHFNTITKGATLYIGMRLKHGMSYKLGMGFGNSVLESYYQYPNGTISFGKERTLNGVYGVTYCANGNFEIAKQIVLLNHIGLEANLVFMTNGFTTEYYDPSYAKGINVDPSYSWIPRNFINFYEALSSGSVYDGKNVAARHNSIGLTLRASYYLHKVVSHKSKKTKS
jgi:hypothetical protein